MKKYTRHELVSIHQMWFDRIPKLQKIAFNKKNSFSKQTKAIILVNEMIRRLPLINYVYMNGLDDLRIVFNFKNYYGNFSFKE